MDWDDLKYFLALTRSQTLSEAAEKLSVNQTTVSRRLKKLQRNVGMRLVHNHNGGIEATLVGAEVTQAALQIESIIASLQRKLASLDEQITGTLRISTPEYLASFENQLFKSFMQRYPQLALEISATAGNNEPLSGDSDIALRWTNQPAEHLVGRKLCRAEFALYDHNPKVMAENPAPNNKLNNKQWIAWEESYAAEITNAWMKRQVPDAVINCRINSALAMYHAVKSGLGIAFLPCAYADPDPLLYRLRDVEKGLGIDIWALTHPDLRGVAKIRAFFQHAEHYFASQRHRYAGRLDPPAEYESSPSGNAVRRFNVKRTH